MPKLGPISCQQWSYLHQDIPELDKISFMGATLLDINTQKDKKKIDINLDQATKDG